MDRSIVGLPDPIAGAPNGERRRCVRQKLHTPVYVSFNGPQAGMVVDLSELLDLHEDGFAVQTSGPLEMNRAVTLCLDLPETKSYIHGSGQVIWSDETGRGGIRFSALSENSRHSLKEWLFANLLVGCSNHAARTEQLARREEERSPEPAPASESRSNESHAVVPIYDASGPLSSLDSVRREVLEIRGSFDAVLQLITSHALSLTGASGAALAFLTDERMICRARTGQPAPPLGAPLDVTHGLSGECVRSGRLVSCEDTENDPRIDSEVSRALGIGSLLAAPIMSDFRVVGLLEVFSPHPRVFTAAQGTILERLVEMIPEIRREPKPPESSHPEKIEPPASTKSETVAQSPALASGPTEFDSIPAIREALKEREPEAREASQPVPGEIVPGQDLEQEPGQDPDTPSAAPARSLYRALLGLTIAAVAMAVGYLLGPTIEKRWAGYPQASPSSVATSEAVSGQRGTDHRAQAESLPELRRLADQGDADAQWQMGVRYHNGEGVGQDDTQAVHWFQLAAEQGNVDAQAHLGAYYWAGRGVPEDLSKAYVWSEIALAGGDENSKARLEGLATRMTRAQVDAARQQAEEWIHSHSQRAKSETH